MTDTPPTFDPIETKEQWDAEGWAHEGIPADPNSRLERVSFQTTFAYPDEVKPLRDAARAQGLTVSAFIKQAALTAAPPPAPSEMMLQSLVFAVRAYIDADYLGAQDAMLFLRTTLETIEAALAAGRSTGEGT